MHPLIPWILAIVEAVIIVGLIGLLVTKKEEIAFEKERRLPSRPKNLSPEVLKPSSDSPVALLDISDATNEWNKTALKEAKLRAVKGKK